MRCAGGGPLTPCQDPGDTYAFTAMGGTCGAHTAPLTLGCDGIEEDACLQLAGGLEDERVDAFTGECARRGGTLVRKASGEACPTADSVAACTVALPSPAQVERRSYYYYGYGDLYDAGLDCERQGGSWVQLLP